MQDYLSNRTALIALERSQAHTADRIPSAKELVVSEIIESLRQSEAISLWSTTQTEDVWRGMPYNLESKARMEKSRLFQLIRGMNKGCALHLHLDASSTTQGLLELAFEQETLCIESDSPFLLDNLHSAAFTFSYLPPSSPLLHITPPNLSILTPSYVPHTLIPLIPLRANFPKSMGGPLGFDRMVRRRLVVDPGSTGWSPKKVWDQFQSIFNLSGGLLGFEPVWEACSYCFIQSFILTEIRSTIRYRAGFEDLYKR